MLVSALAATIIETSGRRRNAAKLIFGLLSMKYYSAFWFRVSVCIDQHHLMFRTPAREGITGAFYVKVIDEIENLHFSVMAIMNDTTLQVWEKIAPL